MSGNEVLQAVVGVVEVDPLPVLKDRNSGREAQATRFDRRLLPYPSTCFFSDQPGRHSAPFRATCSLWGCHCFCATRRSGCARLAIARRVC